MFHKAPSVLLANDLEQSALLLRGPMDRHARWFNPEIWGYLVRKTAIERSSQAVKGVICHSDM